MPVYKLKLCNTLSDTERRVWYKRMNSKGDKFKEDKSNGREIRKVNIF